MYQEIMGRREERVTQMKLISWRQKQATHVHWQEVGAVATSYRYSLEQTGTRNTHLNQNKEPNHQLLKEKKRWEERKRNPREYFRKTKYVHVKNVSARKNSDEMKYDTARTVSQMLQWT